MQEVPPRRARRSAAWRPLGIACSLAVVALAGCSSNSTELAAGGNAEGDESSETTLAPGEQAPDGRGGQLGGIVTDRGASMGGLAGKTTTTTAAPTTTTTQPTTTLPPATLPPTTVPPPTTAPPTTGPPPTLMPVNPPPQTATDLSAQERQLLDAVNAGLASQGRPGLTPATDLMVGPRGEASSMVAQGAVISPSVSTGLSRSWSQLLGQTFQHFNLDGATTVVGSPTILGSVPAGATHAGVGVAVGTGGQVFVSLRFAVA